MKSWLLSLFSVLVFAAPTAAQISVVQQAKQDLKTAGFQVENKACTDFDIAKLVAGRLPGAGLLTKDCCGEATDPNRSHCEFNGGWYAHDIVAFADGSIVDIAVDGGGANGPQWDLSAPDAALVARFRSAVSLGLTGQVPGVTPPPVPTPIPTPQPSPAPPVVDYTPLLQQILSSQVQLLDSTKAILEIVTDTNVHVKNIDRTFAQTMGAVSKFLGKYVAPAVVGFITAKKVGG